MTDDSRKIGAVPAFLHTVLVGTALGATLGFADGLRLMFDGFGGPWLTTVVWYALPWLLLSILAGALVGGLARNRRAASFVLPLVATGVFVVGTTANVAVLPGALGPISLTADALILGLGLFVLIRLYRGGWSGPRPLWWGALLVTAIVLPTMVDEARSPDVAPAPALRPVSSEHPNILLVVVDTLRADHLSLYGYPRDTSPNLDRFAEGAMVFDCARSASSWTKPSVPTILTGLPPGLHGVERRADLLPHQAETIAEDLVAAGYATGLFSDNLFLSARFQHDQGFEHVEDLAGGRATERWRLPYTSLLGRAWSELAGDALPMNLPVPSGRIERFDAPGINRRFLRWVDDLPEGRPWFAYLHYMEPHDPYTPPPPWDEKFPLAGRGGPEVVATIGKRGHAPFESGGVAPPEVVQGLVDAYDAEIAYWDDCFAKLLDSLVKRGLLEDAVVLLTSDHGEGFYEHGTWAHGNSLHEELLRVPLIVRAPRLAPGRASAAVSLEGVAATLLGLSGYERETEPGLPRGAAVLPVPAEDREIRAKHIYHGAIQNTVITDEVKWIVSELADDVRLEKYRLSVDPHERDDVSAANPDDAERVRADIEKRARFEERMGLEVGTAAVDGGLDGALNGLGYLK